MTFIGTYRDLRGQTVGAFDIVELAGRSHDGHPRWRLVCGRCGQPQVLEHGKLLKLVESEHTQTTLRCSNPACELARHSHRSESLSDMRRRELQELKRAEAATADAKASADAKAMRDRAQAARYAELQRSYVRFVNQQWSAGQEDAKICTRQRWCELTDATRRMVLDMIQKDATVRFENL